MAGVFWPTSLLILTMVSLTTALVLGSITHQPGRAAFIGGFIIIGLLLSWRILPLPPAMEVQKTSLTGVVSQLPVIEADYQQTILKCSDYGYQKYIVLYLPPDTRVKSGDWLRVEGKLSTLKGARNPGDPDRRRLKGYQHLFYQMNASNGRVEIIKPTRYPYRQSWYDTFTQLAGKWMTPQSASILTSVIWGDAAALNDDDYRLFQETGLLHVFAASGMNVGCLMLAAALLVGVFTKKRGFITGSGLALAIIYAGLIGWPVSIGRAVLMALFASLAFLGGRKLQIKESLFLAAVLLLIIDPGSLFTPGFQLTVTATWGLMVLYPALVRLWCPSKQSWWQRWLLPVLAAELAVWPLTVYYFNLVAPISFLANLLLAPLISLVVIIGTLALFATPLSAAAVIFFLPCRYLIDLIMYLTTLMHGVPGGYWWVKTPPLVLIIGCFLLLWFLTQTERFKRYWLPTCGLLLLIMITVSWPRVPSGHLEVTFIDVGQGDSIHISTPSGRQVLIDGGGSAVYPVGRMVLLPYLHRQGINQLDLVVNTHPHDDHLLGLSEIWSGIPCSRVVFPLALKQNASIQRLMLPVGTEIIWLQKGDSMQLDDQTKLAVLSPTAEPEGDINNMSLVLELQYSNKKILLMGDAEAPTAKNLLAQGVGEAAIIKIGHHGSAHSSAPDFYKLVNPDLAVISVGRNNGFGHPSAVLLRELKDLNIKVLRTDQAGGIRVVENKGNLSVYTYASN